MIREDAHECGGGVLIMRRKTVTASEEVLFIHTFEEPREITQNRTHNSGQCD
jgi:hypothetical protein